MTNGNETIRLKIHFDIFSKRCDLLKHNFTGNKRSMKEQPMADMTSKKGITKAIAKYR